jgi:hypothetical protein
MAACYLLGGIPKLLIDALDREHLLESETPAVGEEIVPQARSPPPSSGRPWKSKHAPSPTKARDASRRVQAGSSGNLM